MDINSSRLYRPVIKEFTCVGRHFTQVTSTPQPSPKIRTPTVCRNVGVNEYPVMTARQAMNIGLEDSSSPGFGGVLDQGTQTHEVGDKSMIVTPVLVDEVTNHKVEELEEEIGRKVNDHETLLSGVFHKKDLWLFPLSQRKSVSHQTLGLDDMAKHSRSNKSSPSKNKMNTSNQSFLLARMTQMNYGVSKRKIRFIGKDKETIAKSTKLQLGDCEIELLSREERVQMENDQDSRNSSLKRDRKMLSKVNEDTPLPTFSDIVQSSKDGFNALDVTCKRLEKSMLRNAQFLKSEFENDFMNRTAKSAEKVVGSMGKNIVRMQKQMFTYWWGGNNDEDNN